MKNTTRHLVKDIALLLPMAIMLLAGTAVLHADNYKTLRNTYSDSYIGVGMRIGVGGLAATGSIDAKIDQGFTYGFDATYVGELGRHYGFVVGFSLNFLSCGLDAGNLHSEYDGDIPVSLGFGATTDMRAHYIGTTHSVKETYTATFFEIPILFSYSPENWFVHAGLKFGIPISLKAQYSCGSTDVVLDKVISTGTEIEVDWTMDNMAQDPFEGDYTLFGKGGAMRSVSIIATAEIGYKLQFYHNSSLQFSIYGDCGLGTMALNNSANDLILSLDQDNVAYRGLLNAGDLTGLRYFKYGLRVQYNFGLGSSPRSGNPISIL